MAYRDVVLADAPIGYWRLGESSGTQADDESGNGYHGTYVNSPTLGAPGLIRDDDTSVLFDEGSSQYVTSLRVYYARRPDALGNDGTDTLELEAPFADLLVWDLVRDLIRRTAGIEGEKKKAVLDLVQYQEEQLMASFEAHIAANAGIRQERFG